MGSLRWPEQPPSRADVALSGLLVAMELSGFGQDPGVDLASRVVALVLPVALVLRRRAAYVPAAAYLGADLLSVAFGLHPLDSAATVVGIVVGAYAAGAYLPPPAALAALATWWGALAVELAAGRQGATDSAFAALVLACAFAPGVVARRLRRAAEAARAEALRAAQEEAAHAEAAVTRERERIARELHDVVAHAVTVMVVQAAAADELLERDPQRARAALGAVQESGRAAVGELARMLDLLRGAAVDPLTPLPTLARVPELVADAELAGVDVDLRREEIGPLPAAVELCGYRVVQEALTNAAKHARAARVHVVLRCADGALDVLVEDDGGAGAAPGAGTGFGLTGLRERVALFGGALEAGGLAGGGFRVHATVPVGGAR